MWQAKAATPGDKAEGTFRFVRQSGQRDDREAGKGGKQTRIEEGRGTDEKHWKKAKGAPVLLREWQTLS
eukprot:8464803-Alexandrium_andersonii.AAC.1